MQEAPPAPASTRSRLLEVPDCAQCVVCQEEARDQLLEPCGHVCLCGDCMEDLMQVLLHNSSVLDCNTIFSRTVGCPSSAQCVAVG